MQDLQDVRLSLTHTEVGARTAAALSLARIRPKLTVAQLTQPDGLPSPWLKPESANEF